MADSTVEIEAKIDKAEVAQYDWRNKSFADRKRVIRSLKKWLVENQEVCARVACRDTGKTRKCSIFSCPWFIHFTSHIVIDAALGEVLTTCSKMDWLLRHGEKYLRPETRSSPLLLGYKKSQVHYEPLGVVAAIVSYNYRTCFDLFLPLSPQTHPSIFSLAQCLVPRVGSPFRR